MIIASQGGGDRGRNPWLGAWDRSVQAEGLHDDGVKKGKGVNGTRRREFWIRGCEFWIRTCELLGGGFVVERWAESEELGTEAALQAGALRELVHDIGKRDA